MNPDDTVRGVHVPEFLGQIENIEGNVNRLEGDLAEVTSGSNPAGANVGW